MAPKGNKVIHNNHFHKDWQRYVKTFFNQPMRKKRRHAARVEKAKRLAPRPTDSLKPIVRCPTQYFNDLIRLGKGFTLQELQLAGFNKNYARTVGISVDHRRRNKNVEALQKNVKRLRLYKQKLIVFPKNPAKIRPGESTVEETKLATQLKGTLLPLKRQPFRKEKARLITEEEKKFNAYTALSQSRSHARYFGKREKRAKEAAENLDGGKK